MKLRILSLAAAFLACSLSFAETNVITCSTELPDMQGGQGTIPMTVEVLEDKGEAFARITQLGQSYTDQVNIINLPVGENLPADLENKGDANLNMAELMIVHAKTMENDPVFEGMFSTGIEDLTLARSATLYVVGQTTNMGAAVIVELRDAEGQDLGKFLGGFLVTPCK